MRILFVVQRYGAQVPGGAELATREFATRLALRGHATEVLIVPDSHMPRAA